MLAPPLPDKRANVRRGRRAVRLAAEALETFAARFDEDAAFAAGFDQLVTLVHDCPGRIILTGVGKSGIVARKLAATFIATGTQAMYFHAADAALGGVGLIEPRDLVIVISRTGGARQMTPVLSYCRRFGVTLVLLSSHARPVAAKFAALTLNLPRVREAAPVGLGPTTSTTVQLVFGDALAMAVMERRGFSADDFYTFHPSGRLGARLLKVGEIMSDGDAIPRVRADATISAATLEMTRARFGATAVVDAHDALIGAFTDGDLRRAITAGATMSDRVGAWMTLHPATITRRDLATDAVQRMQQQSIMMLFVIDGDRLVGVLHMHDVLNVGAA